MLALLHPSALCADNKSTRADIHSRSNNSKDKTDNHNNIDNHSKHRVGLQRRTPNNLLNPVSRRAAFSCWGACLQNNLTGKVMEVTFAILLLTADADNSFLNNT